MPYLAICRDHEHRDTGALRRRERDAHFAYIESIMERLLVAGPLPEAGSGTHTASLFVYAVDSESEARALLEADPFYRAGIYGECELKEFVPAAGRWIGGTIW